MEKTALNQIHKNLNAKMVNFGGWEMPLEYSGIIEEHQAVRENCGLFDISHMGEILVSGKNAAASLQKIITNNVKKLKKGKIIYSLMCKPDGGIIDDFLVYCLTAEKFLLVVNAANTKKDFKWIKEQVLENTEVENSSKNYSVLALQGPKSKKVLDQFTDIDLNSLEYYRFREAQAAGRKIFISRTGYTGERGYELYFAPDQAEKIWSDIFKAGENFSLKPCGLGARNTLRLEKNYPLYGNDIDESTNPYQANLGWTVFLNNDDFIGREKLKKIKENCCPQKLTPFVVKGRGMARQGYSIFSGEEKIGKVTSGSYSPTLKESIGLAYLKSKYTAPESEIEIKIRKRKIKAEVVKAPFV